MLPFSLSSAPKVFSEVLSVVAAHLHKQGTLIFPYLDNWLLKGWSFNRALVATQRAVHLFLRLQLNIQQSTLALVQSLEFIGVDLDTVVAEALLPSHRFITLPSLVTLVQVSPQTLARNCLQLLGQIATGILVMDHSKLHMRCLQWTLRTVFSPSKRSLNKLLSMPLVVKKIPLLVEEHSLHRSPFAQPSQSVITDASLLR